MESLPFKFTASTATLVGTELINPDVHIEQHVLLLLHGAGVAGDLTWRFVTQHLKGWRHILIPDLPGMGGSAFHSDQPPELESYLVPIKELIASRDVTELSVAGYSLGGMLAMHLSEQLQLSHLFLIEPAALLSPDADELLNRAEQYLDLSDRILADISSENPYRFFLDTVSPCRRKGDQADRLAVERLMKEGPGLAQGVRAAGISLRENAERYCQWNTSISGCSVVGGLTPDSVHERHRVLAEESLRWDCHVAQGADHSLIYTRPRIIANAMNQVLKSV